MAISKEEMLDFIDKAGSDLLLRDTLRDFVKTYDGTNQAEFEAMVMSAVGAMLKAQEYKIKVDHYDQIQDVEEEMQDRLELMKSELATLESGKLTELPPVEAGGADSTE